jgi:hypothetical protein
MKQIAFATAVAVIIFVYALAMLGMAAFGFCQAFRFDMCR